MTMISVMQFEATLQNELRSYKKAHGKTIDRMSTESGVSTATIKKILYRPVERLQVRSDVVKKISEYLSMRLDRESQDDTNIPEEWHPDLFEICVSALNHYCSNHQIALNKVQMMDALDAIYSLSLRQKEMISDDQMEQLLNASVKF